MAFWEKEVAGMTLRQLSINSIIAILILAAGIVIGKVASWILKKGLDRARVEKTKAYNFFKMLIVIIKWSIYILFLNLAIRVLGIPKFTIWISGALIIVPALIGAMILIVIGFAIAVYLKNSVEESNVEHCEVLSRIFFFFVIYVFMVFALKTALISFDSTTVNIIIIVLTGIIGTAFAYVIARRSIRVRAGKISGKKKD